MPFKPLTGIQPLSERSLLELKTHHFVESKPQNHIKKKEDDCVLAQFTQSKQDETQAFAENVPASSKVLSPSIFPETKDGALVGQKVSVPKHWKTDSAVIQTHI